MADTELGELRRPTRPLDERLERIARWRAQGLDTGESDATFPSDATDAAVFAGGGDTGQAAEGSATTPEWLFDEFNLTSSTPNSFALSATPVANSEVVRVNGLVLEPSEYVITGSTLVLDDIAAVRLGIGADTWRLVANYAYFDAASPVFDPPSTITGWNLNGDAVAAGATVVLTDGTTNQAGSMVTTETIPAGWSNISLEVTIDYTPGGSRGDGFVMGLLDSTVHPDIYVGGNGSNLGFGPLTGMVYAAAWIDTYSAGSEAKLSSRDASANVADATLAGYHAGTGVNDYVVTFTATDPGRASATLSWNGSTILSSIADLYVPTTPRVILSGGTGAFVEEVIVTAVTVTTDGAGDSAIAQPGGTYTPPTPPATPGTHVLRYQRPDTTGYTPLDVAAGGTFNLDKDTDYAITASTPVDSNYVRLVGGRNLDIYGVIFDFDAAVPTGSYDGERRGLHIKDGPNPNLKRVIYCEGVYLRSGYYSDGIQVALRYENDVTFICQALRSDAYGWGKKAGVHSDLIQFYGGPLNFFGDCITGKLQTYQGIFMRPADGRSLPSGADKEDWQLSRVNLESATGPSGGAHYLLWDDKPTWTNLTLDEVYITGASGYDVTDGNGNMPATGLFQNATPSGGDWAPSSWWVGDTYTSPGYV